MRPSAARATCLALGLALASCGKLADEHYRTPPLAVLQGTMQQDVQPPTSGQVRMAIVWLAPELIFDLSTYDTPAPVGVLELTCETLEEQSEGSPLCDGTRYSARNLQYCLDPSISDRSQRVDVEPRLLAPFQAPIDALPPALARQDLGQQDSPGALALGELVAFIDEDGDGKARLGTPSRPPEPVLASSVQEPFPAAAGAPRTSYYVAFYDGTAPAAYFRDVSLPRGFSILKRTEVLDEFGSVASTSHSLEPTTAPIELFPYGEQEGRSVLCSERKVEHIRHAVAPTAGPPFQCERWSHGWGCWRRITTGPCSWLEERHGSNTSCAPPPPTTCTSGRWTEVGPMPEPYQAAALLHSGEVLAFGTRHCSPGAALFDPAARAWRRTGAMIVPRSNWASAVVLHSGKVLVAGNASCSSDDHTAELYDPATGTWTATGAMASPRHGHSAALLPSGKVLVVGGQRWVGPDCSRAPVETAELYDPLTGTWSPAALPPGLSYLKEAILLDSGLVLAWADGAVLYDPEADAWLATGQPAASYWLGTLTLLRSGEVLALADTAGERYDPVTGIWIPVAAMSANRWFHSAAELPSRRVLVAGGAAELKDPELDPTARGSTFLFDPVLDAWYQGPVMEHARLHSATVPLPSGAVLLVGGYSPGQASSTSALLFEEGACP